MNLNRKVVRAIVAAGLAIALTTSIALASIGTGTVTASSLRLRSEASTTSTTLAFAPKNSTVTILEQVSEDWYKVEYNSTVGYMSADWLTVVLNAENGVGDTSADTSVDADVSAEPVQGKVNTSVLNVRSGAGTSYSRIGSLKKGTVVTILDDSINGWYMISSGSLTGYVSADYITIGSTDETLKGLVSTGALNVRSGAGTSYSRIGSLKRGATVTILDDSISGWYKISSGSLTGYVSADYIILMDGSVESEIGSAAAAMAASLVGCRYVYGAEGPNTFDCSGLFYYIFRQLGYSITRTSSSQYRKDGVFVSSDEIQPGDLVFFFDPKFDSSGGTLPTTHVGMYVGNNQFIHASTTTYKVQYDKLYGSYYSNYIVGFKRIG